MTTGLIERGQAIRVDDRFRVLADVGPSDELRDEMEQVYNGPFVEQEWGGPLDRGTATDTQWPWDTGNTVDGAPWGWVPGAGRWWLVPLDLVHRGVRVAKAWSWQSGSMTGMSVTAIAGGTTEVAVSWVDNEVAEEPYFDCSYSPDLGEVAQAVLDDMFQYFEPLCPCDDTEGWVVKLQVDEDLAPGLRDRTLNSIWKPCADHADGCSFDNDGTIMTWSGDRWIEDDGAGEAEEL